jgi:isopentenyl-diphosphate delta-isomerase
MTLASAHDTHRVVVCDERGNPLRTAGLLEVHRGEGILHKAFSIFVFRHGGSELLLQQRSAEKPLFPLRWANTCCSHPFPDEPLDRAAARRLREEMGISVPLREAGTFVYRAKDPHSDLSEYEHDTVFVGFAADAPAVQADPSEIADWRWMAVADLQRALRSEPDAYAPWLPGALREALALKS